MDMQNKASAQLYAISTKLVNISQVSTIELTFMFRTSERKWKVLKLTAFVVYGLWIEQKALNLNLGALEGNSDCHLEAQHS